MPLPTEMSVWGVIVPLPEALIEMEQDLIAIAQTSYHGLQGGTVWHIYHP